MATVRDPSFWRRFSVAVHQDEEAKAQRPEPKHSYVSPPPASSSPSTSPDSQSPLLSTTTTTTLPEKLHLQPMSPSSITSTLHLRSPTTPTTPLSKPTRQPSRLAKPVPTHTFTTHRNASQLTLGFSGRPQSRFKFWTQISSDPSNRDSWLESQQRKKRQRTWMCWAFWLGFSVLVAAIVIVILTLRAKKII